MADCECLEGCPFYNDKMIKMPAISTIFKQNYCHGDNTKCARYMIFKELGRPKVPANLFPNQLEEARRILNKY